LSIVTVQNKALAVSQSFQCHFCPTKLGFVSFAVSMMKATSVQKMPGRIWLLSTISLSL